MGYLLVKPEVLKDKGIEHFEKLPDGRGIVDFSMLRVLGSISDVEIVSSSKEVLSLIDEQQKSGLYCKDEPEGITGEAVNSGQTNEEQKGESL